MGKLRPERAKGLTEATWGRGESFQGASLSSLSSPLRRSWRLPAFRAVSERSLLGKCRPRPDDAGKLFECPARGGRYEGARDLAGLTTVPAAELDVGWETAL